MRDSKRPRTERGDFDELTASLDTAGEALVGRLIAARLKTGGAVIAATHHDIAAGVAPQTLMLGAA